MGLLKNAIRSSLGQDEQDRNANTLEQPYVTRPSYQGQSHANTGPRPIPWPEYESTHLDYRSQYTPAQDPMQAQGHNQSAVSFSPPPYTSAFRPVVLPQITFGEGAPFLRGYSGELSRFGILEQDFIRVVDTINAAIVPNPEVKVFTKAAKLTDLFLMGGGSLALRAGEAAIGKSDERSRASSINAVLSQVNHEIFRPRGMEMYIGCTEDVRREAGVPLTYNQRLTMDQTYPEERLAVYGDRIALIDRKLPPDAASGRTDAIATLGQGIEDRETRRKVDRAKRREAKGRTQKADGLQRELKWVSIATKA